jgi:hypothetical protein
MATNEEPEPDAPETPAARRAGDPCPRCGRPLERADDFWYCDNPECSGQAVVRST